MSVLKWMPHARAIIRNQIPLPLSYQSLSWKHVSEGGESVIYKWEASRGRWCLVLISAHSWLWDTGVVLNLESGFLCWHRAGGPSHSSLWVSMVRTQPPALQVLLSLGIPEKERKHPDVDSNPSWLGSWLTGLSTHCYWLCARFKLRYTKRAVDDCGQAVTYMSLRFLTCKMGMTIPLNTAQGCWEAHPDV